MPRRRLKPRNYYQPTGRPHKGLQYPELFGLSRVEVIRLIDTKKWRAFYISWRRKNEKVANVLSFNFTCPVCSTHTPNVDDWHENGESCKSCRYDNDTIIRSQCTSCYKKRAIKFELGSIRLCKECVKLKEEIDKWIKESKTSTAG